MDPKLVAATFGMAPQATLIYLAHRVDGTRLSRWETERSRPIVRAPTGESDLLALDQGLNPHAGCTLGHWTSKVQQDLRATEIQHGGAVHGEVQRPSLDNAVPASRTPGPTPTAGFAFRPERISSSTHSTWYSPGSVVVSPHQRRARPETYDAPTRTAVEHIDRHAFRVLADHRPERTRTGYAQDWKCWTRFCTESGVPLLALTPGTLTAYVE